MSLSGGRRLTPLALAGGGVLLVHHLTYALAGSHVSEGFGPAAVGHAYLRAAAEPLLALSLIGIAAFAFRDWPTAERGWLDLGRRMLAFQVGAFLAMEVLERLSVGASMHDLALVLPIGLALQVPVALAITLVLTWLDVVGRRLLAIAPGDGSGVGAQTTRGVPVHASVGEPISVSLSAALPRGPPAGR